MKRSNPHAVAKIAASLLTARSTTPALACMHVRNGLLIATNHTDTMIQIPTSLVDGTYDRHANLLAQSLPLELEELRGFFSATYEPADLALVDHLGPCSTPHAINLAAAIKRVIHACDPKCDRPVLRSIRVDINNPGEAQFTATDGSFLATYKTQAASADGNDLESFSLPYDAARIIARLDKADRDNDSVGWFISVSEDCIIAYNPATGAHVVSKNIEGAYPDVSRILGDPAARRAAVFAWDSSESQTTELLDCVKHHSGFATIRPSGLVEFSDPRLATIVITAPVAMHYEDNIRLPAKHFMAAVRASVKSCAALGWKESALIEAFSQMTPTDPIVVFKDVGGLTQALMAKF